MLTKLIAALIAAVGIGGAGVYFAVSSDSCHTCPLSGGTLTAQSPSCCPLTEASCDADTQATADESEGCPIGKCCATAKATGQTLATAAAVGCGAFGADCSAKK